MYTHADQTHKHIHTHTHTSCFPFIVSALQDPLNELVGSLEVPNRVSRAGCVFVVLRPLSCCVVFFWSCVVLLYMIYMYYVVHVVVYFIFFN